MAIDTVNQRAGGSTKYVDRRDEDYLVATCAGEGCRKEFTDALKDCVNMGNFKYAVYTDRVYQSIFLEKSKEYRNILKLEKSDKTRSTFYAEVLDLIASLEHAVTEALRAKSNELGRMLTGTETNAVFDAVSSMAVYTPLFERARAKMASRDFALRDAHHSKLEQYISSVPREDFDRFIGEQSKGLDKRLEDAKEILTRLKDR